MAVLGLMGRPVEELGNEDETFYLRRALRGLLPMLHTRARRTMKARDWSAHHDARFAKHVAEASELYEALRGKRGPLAKIGEAADCLFTLLAMIPEEVSVEAVVDALFQKMEALKTSPRKASEDFGERGR